MVSGSLGVVLLIVEPVRHFLSNSRIQGLFSGASSAPQFPRTGPAGQLGTYRSHPTALARWINWPPFFRSPTFVCSPSPQNYGNPTSDLAQALYFYSLASPFPFASLPSGTFDSIDLLLPQLTPPVQDKTRIRISGSNPRLDLSTATSLSHRLPLPQSPPCDCSLVCRDRGPTTATSP
ncbi:hypothetical protein ACRALDRAFT_213330 [Sodiomyces alcalophilus JCM 7366]|uniref:uncharacterized protein n=1 Tax=Sodiomyces alcalophilus JCM 7366 TaxID=591952 RepID=UPI0039B42A46